MVTQTNSRARVRSDAVGDEGLKFLFSEYSESSLEGFRTTCQQLIEKSSGKSITKEKFYRELVKANSKSIMLSRVTNYLMAGQGLGV